MAEFHVNIHRLHITRQSKKLYEYFDSIDGVLKGSILLPMPLSAAEIPMG